MKILTSHECMIDSILAWTFLGGMLAKRLPAGWRVGGYWFCRYLGGGRRQQDLGRQQQWRCGRSDEEIFLYVLRSWNSFLRGRGAWGWVGRWWVNWLLANGGAGVVSAVGCAAGFWLRRLWRWGQLQLHNALVSPHKLQGWMTRRRQQLGADVSLSLALVRTAGCHRLGCFLCCWWLLMVVDGRACFWWCWDRKVIFTLIEEKPSVCRFLGVTDRPTHTIFTCFGKCRKSYCTCYKLSFLHSSTSF